METNGTFAESVSDSQAQHWVPFHLTEEGARILSHTRSLCPECASEGRFSRMLVDAVVYEKDGKVWIAKHCSEHGHFREVYWEDAEMYHRASRFADAGVRLLNPNVTQPKASCPMKCGLCEEHESHTGLANIVVTNRCNLRCWYCFFYVREGGRVYEPDLERIKRMLHVLRAEQPVGAEAVQLTGGEPTLREDIVDIITACREAGFLHVLINTNGIELSRNPELMRRMKEAGSRNGGHIILYMSFDGVTPETNPKNYWEVPGVIRNATSAGMNMMLVPTVIRGVNLHQVGDIIRFAFGNINVVRGVNFQPVSLVGRMPRKEREKQRVTIPGVIKAIEEQTGIVGREDFFPVPSTARLTDFMESIFARPKYRLSTHFACGMATYLFRKGNTLVPLTKFFDVEGFFEFLQELRQEVESSRFKIAGRGISILKALAGISRFVDEKEMPEYLDIKRVLLSALTRGSYRELTELNRNSLFIGMMHFQDTYNYDVARVRKCSVHYALPDLRIVPFCAFNVLPELYRDRVQERFSISVSEWEARTGKRLRDDMYVRRLSEEERRRVQEFYRESMAKAGF